MRSRVDVYKFKSLDASKSEPIRPRKDGQYKELDMKDESKYIKLEEFMNL